MRLRIEDVTREPVAEAVWLTDYVIRYRLAADPAAVHYANGRECIVATPCGDRTIALRHWPELPDEESLVCSAEHADAVALRHLSRGAVFRLRARNGDASAELTVRAAGHAWMASLLGQDFWVETGSGSRELEPCRVWYEFRPLGYTIECCATCEHFAMSGLSRDMSGGAEGYCLAQGTPSAQTLVTVTYVCPEYTLVPRVPRHLGGLPRP